MRIRAGRWHDIVGGGGQAGTKKKPFVVNSRRFDPYRNFRFRVSFAPLAAAAVAGTAAFFLVRSLSGKRSEVTDSHDRYGNP